MKTYYVKRYWEVSDEVKVEANSVDEAIEKAHEMPLTEGYYVDDSINSDPEVDVEEAALGS